MLLSYSLAALVAFSGLFVGATLAFFTQEELPVGRRYFPWMQKLLLIAIVSVVLHALHVQLLYRIVAYAALLLLLLRTAVPNLYPFLGFLFFFSGVTQPILYLVSVLIFLYGFPTGSLLVAEPKKTGGKTMLKQILIRYGAFVPIAVLAQIAFQFFS